MWVLTVYSDVLCKQLGLYFKILTVVVLRILRLLLLFKLWFGDGFPEDGEDLAKHVGTM